MNNVILCGMPGSGKTETGKLIAAKLGWQFIDTDQCLEQYFEERTRQHLACREIHRQLGDIEFRQLENQVLHTLSDAQYCVISIGGGTLTLPSNIKILKEIGKFVYLKNDPDVIFERLMKKGVPSYLDPLKPYDSFEKLYQQRTPIYDDVADVKIETKGMTPDEVALFIIEKIKRNFKLEG